MRIKIKHATFHSISKKVRSNSFKTKTIVQHKLLALDTEPRGTMTYLTLRQIGHDLTLALYLIDLTLDTLSTCLIVIWP